MNININTSYRYNKDKLTPKKYDDTYAGPDNNPESEIEPIFQYTTNNKYDYYHFNNTHIIITEPQPTQEQINLLQHKNITLIYTPHQDSVIIRHLQDRQQYFKDYNPETHRYEENPDKPLTRSYIFNQLLASKLLTATIYLTEYNNTEEYYTSFQHLIKQLAIHRIRTKFTDTQNDYTLNIHEDTFANSNKFIQPHDMEQFNNLMQPYHAYLSELTRTNTQLYKDKISDLTPIHTDIITYIHTWAPAYDIEIPTTIMDTMNLYHQLKYYEDADIPINDDYTICPHCNKPYPLSLIHNDLPCPHCEQLDEETLDELYQDYTPEYTWHVTHYPTPELPEPHVQPTPHKQLTYLDKPLTLPAFHYELCDIYQPLWTAIATNDLD